LYGNTCGVIDFLLSSCWKVFEEIHLNIHLVWYVVVEKICVKAIPNDLIGSINREIEGINRERNCMEIPAV
jgi:hypothetical protein